MFVNFSIHTKPVVSTADMESFLSRSPDVFGGLWTLLCDIRGLKPGQAREKSRTTDKLHALFVEILTLACISNRRRLNHWAMIANVAHYAGGVARSAEQAILFFGSTISYTTRRKIF